MFAVRFAFLSEVEADRRCEYKAGVVYITISEAFWPQIRLKYSKLDEVEFVDQIQHPIIREAMKLTGVTGPYLDIVGLLDIPAGTGLGSSGSFTTALLRALHAVNRRFISPQELAEQACHIEINLLKEPVEKQDQYISAFGGITCLNFSPMIALLWSR